jgi:DNA-directed RNA polymerase subunit RPC12/RpoP
MATVFEELNAINVNDKVEKKKSGGTELTYLSWTWAWSEVKKRYPDAHYEIVMHNGLPYVYDENTGYMVFTNVTIDGITHSMWLPVMDGANKAMKNHPYKYATKYNGEKTVDAATMFDINKTMMRCLVKNLAMFGLGLYIYAGEDLPQDIKEYVCADCGKVVDSNMAQRTHKAFGVHLCKECGLERSKKKEEGTNGS